LSKLGDNITFILSETTSTEAEEWHQNAATLEHRTVLASSLLILFVTLLLDTEQCRE